MTLDMWMREKKVSRLTRGFPPGGYVIGATEPCKRTRFEIDFRHLESEVRLIDLRRHLKL